MNDKLNIPKFVKNVLATFIILAIIYFGIVPFLFGGEKMKNFCGQITPGMQADEVYKSIKQTHYKYLENKEGYNHTITIIDSKAMGRFICEVALSQNRVVESRYIYND